MNVVALAANSRPPERKLIMKPTQAYFSSRYSELKGIPLKYPRTRRLRITDRPTMMASPSECSVIMIG